MKVAFRTDLSVEIGTGHFMRCLTLARQLKQQGVDVHFFCRHLTPVFSKTLRNEGFGLSELTKGVPFQTFENGYSKWLGVSEKDDANNLIEILNPDEALYALVVDHYAISSTWEKIIRPHCDLLVVIDDLANREHDCNLLIDSSLHSNLDKRYENLVPEGCELLLGPQFAPLRPAFSEFRRNQPARNYKNNKTLISLGGIDKENHSLTAIQAVKMSGLTSGVDVVIGSANPHQEQLQRVCSEIGFRLHIQTDEIAKLMSNADICIGAAGSSTWERMCLGLPTLSLCVAENQNEALQYMSQIGLAYAPILDIEDPEQLCHYFSVLAKDGLLREKLSLKGRKLIDGLGASRIVSKILKV